MRILSHTPGKKISPFVGRVAPPCAAHTATSSRIFHCSLRMRRGSVDGRGIFGASQVVQLREMSCCK